VGGLVKVLLGGGSTARNGVPSRSYRVSWAQVVSTCGIINGNWGKGRANIQSPKKVSVSCSGYVCKYLRKMEGWNDVHLALLWNSHCRMYGFSRGFLTKAEEKVSKWQLWTVLVLKVNKKNVHIDRLAALIQSLKEGGYVVVDNKNRLNHSTCSANGGGA